MRVSIWVTVLVAVLALALVLIVGQLLIKPDLPLITQASFSLDTLTPNADGESDVSEFSYTLSRSAKVSLSFEAEDGTTYYFRKDELRGPQEYSVLFSGVVDGFLLPSESTEGTIERRLIPDGTYMWKLQGVDENGSQDEIIGTLQIQSAGSQLPNITGFSVSPSVFAPNQDGIADRVYITTYLTKAADLTVKLVGTEGQEILIAERDTGREIGDVGRHDFEYDGGIDRGVEPPADGDYRVVATAQDAEGQRISYSLPLTIVSGGTPKAEIAPQPSGIDVDFMSLPYDSVYFSASNQLGERLALPDNLSDLGFTSLTMPVGDMLVFKLMVENYGTVPIRTSGPWPGTVYQWDQVWGAMGVYEQSGSWRVGLRCSTSTVDWPYRWAIGSPETLQAVLDEQTGNTYYYLPPGESSVVWGAVRMTELIAARNPQQCWAGLIHEDVAVVNQRVGARDITLFQPETASENDG